MPFRCPPSVGATSASSVLWYSRTGCAVTGHPGTGLQGWFSATFSPREHELARDRTASSHVRASWPSPPRTRLSRAPGERRTATLDSHPGSGSPSSHPGSLHSTTSTRPRPSTRRPCACRRTCSPAPAEGSPRAPPLQPTSQPRTKGRTGRSEGVRTRACACHLAPVCKHGRGSAGERG
jgi:hypothetical protein